MWHSSLTAEDSTNLERVQKSALKIILQEDYDDYDNSLQRLNLQTLYERRTTLCETFARNTANHDKLGDLFPKNIENPLIHTRKHEEYKVNMAFTERYKNSAIPFMQRLLNKIDKKK